MQPVSKQARTAAMAVVVMATLLFAAIACDKSNPARPTPVCSFTLSNSSQDFSSGGGPGAVSVDTDSQCSWSVGGASGWVTLQSPTSVTGPGTVNFTVLPNTAVDSRSKGLTIAGSMFMVNQAGHTPCAFSIAPEEKSFGNDGGTGQVEVTTTAGCEWTATSNAAWITTTGSARGSGSGAVSYSVAPNNASAARSGTMTVAGLTFSVTQAGEGTPEPSTCEYSVAPIAFEPCMQGGRVTASLTTQANCAWTADTSAGWLSLPNGKSGKGSGTIAIAFSDNYDVPREGVVMVRWPTPTAGQNLHVEQAGCLYSVTQSAFSYTSAAANGSFSVLQESVPNSCGGALQDRCVWTARPNVPWITITTSMPRQGDSPVSFSVSANTGTSSRTGTVTVKDKIVTVTQSAP
jgi:Viral BACON domain/Putative binding domain, N-terminal